MDDATGRITSGDRDNDDARPFRFSAVGTWDFRYFHSIGAVLFGRADFKAVSGRWHQEGAWLLDAGARDRFDKLASEPPSRRSIALATSGYVVLRSGWDADADYVCFDVGEIAGGLRTDDIPSAGHGHADCLAVVVVPAGMPLFVDAGFYTYNSSDDWEQLFRATELHNTVRLDGRSQARYFGKMTWAQVPRVALEASRLDDGAGVMWARGSHDGYARGATGVRHTRTVVLKPGAYAAIFDELTGQGDHVFDIGYMCSPERSVERRGAQFAIGDVTIALAASCPIDVTVVRGDTPAGRAWTAPSLDVRQQAERIVGSGQFRSPGVEILTVVAWKAPRVEACACDEDQVAHRDSCGSGTLAQTDRG